MSGLVNSFPTPGLDDDKLWSSQYDLPNLTLLDFYFGGILRLWFIRKRSETLLTLGNLSLKHVPEVFMSVLNDLGIKIDSMPKH